MNAKKNTPAQSDRMISIDILRGPKDSHTELEFVYEAKHCASGLVFLAPGPQPTSQVVVAFLRLAVPYFNKHLSMLTMIIATDGSKLFTDRAFRDECNRMGFVHFIERDLALRKHAAVRH